MNKLKHPFLNVKNIQQNQIWTRKLNCEKQKGHKEPKDDLNDI